MKRHSAAVTVGGIPQIWIGANFWSRTGGPLMWRDYDGAVIEVTLPAFGVQVLERRLVDRAIVGVAARL
jgi:hypothetical protein